MSIIFLINFRFSSRVKSTPASHSLHSDIADVAATAPKREARYPTEIGIALIFSLRATFSVIIKAHFSPARLKVLLALVTVIPISRAAAASIAQTGVPGVGLTYVARVTVSLTSYNGLSGIGISNFYGEYSWGRLSTMNRTYPKSFTNYNNGIAGVSSSPTVQRLLPLKYRDYTT